MKPAALDLAIATVPVGSLSPDPDNGRVHGRTLLEHDLVDKYRLTMDPVVVAAATLFGEGSLRALRLAGQVASTGAILETCTLGPPDTRPGRGRDLLGWSAMVWSRPTGPRVPRGRTANTAGPPTQGGWRRAMGVSEWRAARDAVDAVLASVKVEVLHD